MSKDVFLLESYDYELPESQIAQKAHDPADECKLMIVDRVPNSQSPVSGLKYEIFNNGLLNELNSDYVIFFNNSKVVRARIPLNNANIIYEDKVIHGIEGELFYLGPNGNNAYQFMVKPGSKLKVGTIIMLGENRLSIIDNFDYGRIIRYDGDIFDLLEIYGQMPLPPYVEYSQEKESDYQPAMAKEPGSVASPTASLHFTPKLLNELGAQGVEFDYVTLHVGIGTFRPIKTKSIKDFDIHSELCQVDLGIFERIMNYKLNHKTIIAVGTTACRTLESLPYLFVKCEQILSEMLSTETFNYWKKMTSILDYNNDFVVHPDIKQNHINFACKLYITPGFQFHIIDQLITNFHLPKSSLMVLLASFMGHDFMMQAYEEAIKKNYMFYSFGDAMRIR